MKCDNEMSTVNRVGRGYAYSQTSVHVHSLSSNPLPPLRHDQHKKTHQIRRDQHVMSRVRCVFSQPSVSLSVFSLLSFSHSLKSCLIWKLASFGKLAIRTILLEYVSVSLVFLPINSWSSVGGVRLEFST